MNGSGLGVRVRAAVYLRVSTGRQAEHDLSIPDQKAHVSAWVAQRGWIVAAEYVEAGASATDDRRPEFQRMIERASEDDGPFDVIVVHSFSRFFRDAFGLEFYVRKLAKHGVRLVSITQELGDDPAQVMMRQVIALFDEYQSKENAKHVLRSMKENARQGYWNGSRPPFGYKAVEVERRGSRIKKSSPLIRSRPRPCGSSSGYSSKAMAVQDRKASKPSLCGSTSAAIAHALARIGDSDRSMPF